MLSKAKGQILRVAACIHVLFSDFKGHEHDNIIPTIHQISPEISEAAIVAAQNFVEICCQHCLAKEYLTMKLNDTVKVRMYA